MTLLDIKKVGIKNDLAIYVHWPFCLSKCPYCDFNSHVETNIDYSSMTRAYVKELKTLHQKCTNQQIIVKSIFFGGGTPSLMPAEMFETLLSTISNLWSISENVEVTIEANPSSVSIENFSAYKTAGVNRLSLGVQSFKNSALKFLGREHDALEAKKAIEIGSKIFDRISIDLIYGRPGQLPQEWEIELSDALKYPIQHISLYQLTIEKGTEFFSLFKKGRFVLPPDEVQTDMFNICLNLTQKANMQAYEISNYSKPGEESLHNLAYWLYKPYLGVGPGAHGRLPNDKGGRQATRMHSKPKTWLDAVSEFGHGAAYWKNINASERAAEALLMGLRLEQGIEIKNFEDRTGVNINEAIKIDQVRDLEKRNFLEFSDTHLRITNQGRLVMNSIINKIAA